MGLDVRKRLRRCSSEDRFESLYAGNPEERFCQVMRRFFHSVTEKYFSYFQPKHMLCYHMTSNPEVPLIKIDKDILKK